MKQSAGGARLAAALVPVVIAGCAGEPVVKDGAPARTEIDFSRIPDAVPRQATRSRYGNPESYVEFGQRYHVLDEADGFVQRGSASWYGTKFHGRRTASGEVYDMYKMTAAHRTLPLPSWVEVTLLSTGRSVVVKVNDRGPFHDDRIIDLSYAAARKLGFADEGTARVQIRVIDPAKGAGSHVAERTGATIRNPRPKASAVRSAVLAVPGSAERAGQTEALPGPVSSGSPAGALYLQVGAFASRENAERLRQRLSGSVSPVFIQRAQSDRRLYRVRIGPLASESEADSLFSWLSEAGIRSPRIVRD